MKKIVLGLICSLGLSVPAFAGPQERGLLAGAAVGATAGAVIGSQSNETAQGAMIGAMFGAIAGAVLASDREQVVHTQRSEPRSYRHRRYGHQGYSARVIDDDDYAHARVYPRHQPYAYKHTAQQRRAYLRQQRALQRAHVRHERREAYARHEYREHHRATPRAYGRVGGMVRNMFANGQYYARAD